jgi:hypothetical protein
MLAIETPRGCCSGEAMPLALQASRARAPCSARFPAGDVSPGLSLLVGAHSDCRVAFDAHGSDLCWGCRLNRPACSCFRCCCVLGWRCPWRPTRIPSVPRPPGSAAAAGSGGPGSVGLGHPGDRCIRRLGVGTRPGVGAAFRRPFNSCSSCGCIDRARQGLGIARQGFRVPHTQRSSWASRNRELEARAALTRSVSCTSSCL